MAFVNLAKKILFITFLILLLLFICLVYRAYVIFKPCEHNINPINESERLKLTNEHIKRLQKAISFPTVSHSIGYENKEEKLDYVNFIRTGLFCYIMSNKNYSNIFILEIKQQEFNDLESYEFVQLELVNNCSFLYTIRGSDNSLQPYLLAAHYDVVPSDGIGWNHKPFLGYFINSYKYK